VFVVHYESCHVEHRLWASRLKHLYRFLFFLLIFFFKNLVWFSLRPYFYRRTWTWLRYFLLCSLAAHFLINIFFETSFKLINFLLCSLAAQWLRRTDGVLLSCCAVGAAGFPNPPSRLKHLYQFLFFLCDFFYWSCFFRTWSDFH
jgi:hypothetical protein